MATFLLLAAALLVIGWFGWQRNTKNSRFYGILPCVGVRKDEWFAWTRAQLRSFSKTEEWMKEGYEMYSRHNQPFIIPSFRKGKVLILPPAQLKAIYNKREDELLAHDPASEALSFEWTIRDREVYPSSYTVDVIRKWITKRFDEFAAELQDELCLAVDEQFGMSQDWREVKLWPAVQRIFTRGLNRVLVGFPLCRDEAFLETMRRFAIDMPFQGLFITLVPKVLKPIFAPLISWNARRDTEAGIKYCTPIIQDYLKANQNSISEKPVNILQWIIEASAATGDPSQLDAHRIGHRMMILNFNLVQGGSIPFSTVLSDICNGGHAASTFSQLRDEATSVLASTKIWDRATISKLVLADSAIRESMRWSDFGLFALPRRVNSPGITVDNGIYVPPGVHIEIPMHSIHTDEGFYADAGTFKPFRFADGTSPSRSAVTLDETFLGFGYGKNACPGRFFGLHVMKVVLAYLVMNYDVEFGSEEPPMRTMWEYRIPRESTSIKIRRRMQARNST
ncbi:cytochrome P450 monooxygenase [Fusarium denticulatum]|uniref:Cytochrome P450 monooxygenase n=1 Tax=Fusarium denticulatum TaxID=48507 RepID=A0A8H5U3W4_9HYPO|nr:cytochrome P450 monooxygenase [Fusarium denticulatum]